MVRLLLHRDEQLRVLVSQTIICSPVCGLDVSDVQPLIVVPLPDDVQVQRVVTQTVLGVVVDPAPDHVAVVQGIPAVRESPVGELLEDRERCG